MSELPVISVIDDDASVRAATNNLLSSHGYQVHTFASAEEFLQSAGLNDLSCVIADVQMPAMNGLALLAHIRAQGYAVPFVFITAFPEEDVRARDQLRRSCPESTSRRSPKMRRVRWTRRLISSGWRMVQIRPS